MIEIAVIVRSLDASVYLATSTEVMAVLDSVVDNGTAAGVAYQDARASVVHSLTKARHSARSQGTRPYVSTNAMTPNTSRPRRYATASDVNVTRWASRRGRSPLARPHAQAMPAPTSATDANTAPKAWDPYCESRNEAKASLAKPNTTYALATATVATRSALKVTRNMRLTTTIDTPCLSRFAPVRATGWFKLASKASLWTEPAPVLPRGTAAHIRDRTSRHAPGAPWPHAPGR